MKRALASLRFFNDGPQGPNEDAIGYHGFYYHFLDMKNGCRFGNSEISTIDSAYLIAGAITAAAYFDRDTKTSASCGDSRKRSITVPIGTGPAIKL